MDQKAYKILVVDDETDILSICGRLLKREGLEVTTADGGKKALELASRETFDLILTDIKMPEVGGIELIKSIKETSPQSEVIIMTGSGAVETAIEAIRLGAFDYILKPFGASEMLTAVNRCLEYAKLRRQEKVFRETTYLYHLAQEITKTRDEGELLQFILERVTKALKADSGSIFLVHPDSEKLIPMARVGKPAAKEYPQMVVGERVAGWVAEKRKPVLIQGGFENQPQFKGIDVRPEISSSMVAPLIHQEALIGVVCLSRFVRGTPYPFSDRDLESLEIFVLHATLILIAIRHQQALRELDALKSEFLANASHELRTPLTAISGALELLVGYGARARLDEKGGMLIDLIDRNTGRMRRLVDDLLDFSRMETGRVKLEKTRFELRPLIEETIKDLVLRAKEKNITVSLEGAAGANEIYADRERIRQVLVNLVNNAIKFTPEGGSIIVRYANDGNGTTQLSVSDTGVGIPSDKREKIFEKFYQVDGSVSRVQSGFGLGLAIAKSIVQAHDGKIWVESEPGKGSTFHLSINSGEKKS